MALLLDEQKLVLIERRSAKKELPDLLRYLNNQIGLELTAYIAGLREPKVVLDWEKGKGKPFFLQEYKLRLAYQVVQIILFSYDKKTLRTWLFGENTRLSDTAPAKVLRERVSIDLDDLMSTAKAFAASVE